MIRHLLASTQNRSDEIPNQELAIAICEGQHPEAIPELIAYLYDKDKKIQHDSIKILYEIGDRNGLLIAPYTKDFIELLQSKNNRMVWGAMTALYKICCFKPQLIYPHLPIILDCMDRGSVISRDNAVFILIALAKHKTYANAAQLLLLEQMQKAPINQLPMYAERSLECWSQSHQKRCIDILQERFSELGKASREKRILKLIKKLS